MGIIQTQIELRQHHLLLLPRTTTTTILTRAGLEATTTILTPVTSTRAHTMHKVAASTLAIRTESEHWPGLVGW